VRRRRLKEISSNLITAAFLQPHVNGKQVMELPFVDADAAPQGWSGVRKWKGVKLICDGSAVLAKTSFESAAAFLLAHPHQLLCPEKEHRADGVMLLGDGCLLELGMKFHSTAVQSDEVRSQFRSTDPTCAYERADAWKYPGGTDRFNSQAAAKREAWTESKFDKRTALRVHVTLPRPSGVAVFDVELVPGTHFLGDGSIVVNLDASNIHMLLGVPSPASPAASGSSSSVVSSVVGRLTRSTGRESRARDRAPLVAGAEAANLRAVYRVLYEVTGARELLRWC